MVNYVNLERQRDFKCKYRITDIGNERRKSLNEKTHSLLKKSAKASKV